MSTAPRLAIGLTSCKKWWNRILLLAVISARQAVSIVPQSYANLSWPQVRFIPLKQRIPAGVYALYHPETQSNIKRMIDELKQAIERERNSRRESRENEPPSLSEALAVRITYCACAVTRTSNASRPLMLR
ncbi:hypothetical protein [Vibrio sp. 03_296]|uniref:hypothetical protein n=1 Tax=Vibrio sp. 03_296 TaxID=2024409 RepID=UPI002D7FB281|nr:hypothetical protein [Vibrio sp. 03_296]